MEKKKQAKHQQEDARGIPFAFEPLPLGWQGIAEHFGLVAQNLFVLVVRSGLANYKRTGILEIRLPDNDQLAARLDTSEQSVIAARGKLEKAAILGWTGKKRTCRFDTAAIRRLSREPVEKKPRGRFELGDDGKALRDEDGRAICRPRTKPEGVTVRIPGSLQEVPIDQACEAHGGRGAKCSCPLHKITAVTLDDSKGTYTPPVKVDFNSGDPPPPESEAIAPAESGAQPQPKEPDAEARLLAALTPVCNEVWHKSPAGGSLIDVTGCAMGGWHDPVLPYLIARIRGCAGNPKKKIGLLPNLAADAWNDYQADAPRRQAEADAQQRAEHREQDRAAQLAADEAREQRAKAAIEAMGQLAYGALVRAETPKVRRRYPAMTADQAKAEAERIVRRQLGEQAKAAGGE